MIIHRIFRENKIFISEFFLTNNPYSGICLRRSFGLFELFETSFHVNLDQHDLVFSEHHRLRVQASGPGDREGAELGRGSSTFKELHFVK